MVKQDQLFQQFSTNIKFSRHSMGYAKQKIIAIYFVKYKLCTERRDFLFLQILHKLLDYHTKFETVFVQKITSFAPLNKRCTMSDPAEICLLLTLLGGVLGDLIVPHMDACMQFQFLLAITSCSPEQQQIDELITKFTSKLYSSFKTSSDCCTLTDFERFFRNVYKVSSSESLADFKLMCENPTIIRLGKTIIHENTMYDSFTYEITRILRNNESRNYWRVDEVWKGVTLSCNNNNTQHTLEVYLLELRPSSFDPF
jgi:hypothetical protein